MEIVDQYSVLEIIPKKEILIIHLKCLLANLLMMIKWCIDFVKSRFSSSTLLRRSVEATPEFPSSPPTFMMETNLGRHSYVKLDNIKLHFLEAGNRCNPEILLLHGFPDCWISWRYQISALSRHFHVIALDLKGFNDSDKPTWRYDYTPRKICEELRKFLKALSCKSVTIIGHDVGAIIGWIFAHIHPELVDKFISVSTPHPNLLWDNIPDTSVFNKKWLQFVQLPYLPEIEMKHNAEKILKKCYGHINKEKMYFTGPNGTQKNDLMEAYKYIFHQTDDWTGALNYYRNFMFYRIKSGEILDCPTLVITGNDDKFYKLESVVRSTDYCENFSIKVIENAGHWPHQDAAEEFNTSVLKFILGKRAILTPPEPVKSPNKGLVDRMWNLTNSKIGTQNLFNLTMSNNLNKLIK